MRRCLPAEAGRWKAACTGALLGTLVAAALLAWIGPPWGWGMSAAIGWLVLPALIGAITGAALLRVSPSFERWLLGPDVLRRAAERRAAVAFVDEQIFATRDRTGVLLFFALFEHQVIVLTDRGVRERITDEIVDRMAATAAEQLHREGDDAAIERAVAACGRILVDAGIERRDDDVNELPDEPRTYDA